MGDYLVTDMITRLPILRGEEVLMLFGYDAKGMPKEYMEESHPFYGGFHPKADRIHRIKCFFGTYNEYGWINENDQAEEFMGKGGRNLFMRKTTYDFIMNEYRNTPVDRRCYLAQWYAKHNADATKEAFRLVNDDDAFMKSMLGKHGFDGVFWAFMQLKRNWFEDHELNDDMMLLEKNSVFLDNEKSMMSFIEHGIIKQVSDECREAIARYASDHSQILAPLEWYCIENRISPDGARHWDGEQWHNFAMSKRLAEFTASEAEKHLEIDDDF